MEEMGDENVRATVEQLARRVRDELAAVGQPAAAGLALTSTGSSPKARGSAFDRDRAPLSATVLPAQVGAAARRHGLSALVVVRDLRESWDLVAAEQQLR
ncbi:hypothetical protein [Kitasatospora sp. NPDC057541]|uniref:hypothetical protein n=1 Tax=Kitasatospora sp. NPDC057541 TaxID=3346161 RepID=UPI0036BF4043